MPPAPSALIVPYRFRAPPWVALKEAPPMLRPSLPTAPLLMVAPLMDTPCPPVMLAARAM
ncbi:hypothetical protein NB689_002883 [Xanthomonas sacchari]|nr:hypothetical protein [Xanthomonas sacchari]